MAAIYVLEPGVGALGGASLLSNSALSAREVQAKEAAVLAALRCVPGPPEAACKARCRLMVALKDECTRAALGWCMAVVGGQP